MAVVVPIVADFDPAGIKSADAAFKSFGQNLSKVLGQASRSAAQSLEAVEDGANDARTAAQRLAEAIDKSSAALQADIDKSAAAARALGNALGPELTAKLGNKGIQNLIRDFTRMGLTLDDVAAEADTLAASLKQLDSITVDPINNELGKVNTTLDHTAAGVERANGVFGGFVGGAVTELPGVTSAFGPLAQAIDQTVSGLIEGNFNFAQLAKFAGPVAAVAGGVFLISEGFAASAKNSELLRENTEIIKTALVSGEKAAAAFFNTLRENREIKIFDRRKGIFGDVSDIEQDLFDLKIRLSDIEVEAVKGVPALTKYRDALDAQREALGPLAELNRENRLEYDRLRRVSRFITDYLNAVAKGTNEAARENFIYGESLTTVEAALREQIDATVEANPTLFDYGQVVNTVTAYQQQLADEADRTAQGYQDQADSIGAARSELFKYLDIGRTERENAKTTAEARDELRTARKKGTADDIIEAEEKYGKALEDEAEFAADAFIRTTKLKDEKLKQALANETAISVFQREMALLDPSSAEMQNLQRYIDLLRTGIPTDISTTLRLNYSTGSPVLPSLFPASTSSAGGGGIGNVTINLSTLNPDDAAARAIARAMNQAADRAGTTRPFPWAGV